MAKLTATQKEEFLQSARWLHMVDMQVFYSRDARAMVGVQPEMENGNIYRLFVTLCHKNDDFKKKLGLIALHDKNAQGNYVQFRANSPGWARVFAIDFLEKLGAIDTYEMPLQEFAE